MSRDSVPIAMIIATLNDLDMLACNIYNVYLTTDCREQVWAVAGPNFGSEYGKNILVKKSLYGLKRPGTAFRAFLSDTMDVMGYRQSYNDPE